MVNKKPVTRRKPVTRKKITKAVMANPVIADLLKPEMAVVTESELSLNEEDIMPEQYVEDPPKKVVRRSWKPVRMLDIPKELLNPNYVYRHCTNSKPGNINKKLSEGWEIDKYVLPKMRERGLVPPETIEDGKQLDNVFRIREMILMRMPKPVAESRSQYFNDLADKQGGSLENTTMRGIPTYLPKR